MSIAINGSGTITGISQGGLNDNIITQAELATTGVAGNGPAFSAYLNGSNQVFNNATWTKVTINAEEYDTASCFDTSTNRFTPNVAGYYLFTACANMQAETSGRTITSLYKNGVIDKRGGGSAYSSQTQQQVLSAHVYLNGSTDYVEFYVYQDSGTTAELGAGIESTYFQGFLARAA